MMILCYASAYNNAYNTGKHLSASTLQEIDTGMVQDGLLQEF